MRRQFSIFNTLVKYLIYSLFSSFTLTFLLLYVARYLYFRIPLSPEINYFIANLYIDIGVFPLFIVTMFCAFILFYLLYLYNFSLYFQNINQSVQQLSEGHFPEMPLPVKSRNGLGLLARNINMMKDKLASLIQEERRAITSKNELVTNVSHDLRTPLTSIIGYLRLIEEDNYKDEVELRYYTTIAFEKSQRLNKMVNDLFEYTKIHNQDLELNIQNFNLIELLQQLSAQFYPELRKDDMEIFLNSTSEKIIINADPEKLMRVFENLISNAIKYGKNGQTIHLLIEELDFSIVVKVKNVGEKIPTAAIPLLFNRLYRVEQSRSETTGGSGLGLAIAKGILELHRGNISVSSNEKETIFVVELPK